MRHWLFAPPHDNRLLPGGRLRGATPYVIAIMTFVMIMVAAAGLALANAAAAVASGIENRYVVQVPSGTDMGRTLATLRSVPGVTGVEIVSEAEMRRTLEQWLGPAASADDLPVPALVNFDLEDPRGLGSVTRSLVTAVPGANVSGHEQSLGPILRSIRTLQWLALALVLLMGAAASAAVVLAARGALDTHRPTVEIMHGIGATDVQVVRLFQRKIALDASVGALAGTSAAVLVLLLVIGGQAALAGGLAGSAALGAADALILAVLPIVLIVVATIVARAAVLGALRRAP